MMRRHTFRVVYGANYTPSFVVGKAYSHLASTAIQAQQPKGWGAGMTGTDRREAFIIRRRCSDYRWGRTCLVGRSISKRAAGDLCNPTDSIYNSVSLAVLAWAVYFYDLVCFWFKEASQSKMITSEISHCIVHTLLQTIRYERGLVS